MWKNYGFMGTLKHFTEIINDQDKISDDKLKELKQIIKSIGSSKETEDQTCYFQNKIIFLTYRFFIDHMQKLEKLLNLKMYSHLNVFIDDAMGCLNQRNRNKLNKYPNIEGLAIETFWLAIDIYQFFYYCLNDTIIFNGLDMELEIFNLNDVYRCTNEVFTIYLLLYNELREWSNKGLEQSKDPITRYFKCFECFRRDSRSKPNKVDSKEKIQKTETPKKIKLTTFKNLFENLSKFDEEKKICKQLWFSGKSIIIPCESNKLLAKVKELIEDKLKIKNKDDMAIIVDGNKLILDELKKHKEFAFEAEKLLQCDLTKKLNEEFKNNKSITIISTDNSKFQLSKEYQFVIYVVPGLFGFMLNCKQKDEKDGNMSFRFDAYFSVSRATQTLIILYVECSGN